MSSASTESCNDIANGEEIPSITSRKLCRRLFFENDKDLWKIIC